MIDPDLVAKARQWLVENEGFDPNIHGDRLDDTARILANFYNATLEAARAIGLSWGKT